MALQNIEWHGDTLNVLKGFSDTVKYRIGTQILNLQRGLDPDNWKPMGSIGAGVREIRVLGDDGQYRVIYYTQRENMIDILHIFKKKTQKTSKQDIEKAKSRFKKLEF